MGLFDFLSGSGRDKAGSSDSGGNAESLREYSGMRVEVFNERQKLLFVAKMFVMQGGIVELQIPQEARESAELYWGPDMQPFPASLRGYEEKSRMAIHMTGLISRLTREIWRVEQLRVTGRDNDRSFFRQGIDSAVAEVSRIGSPGDDTKVCEVRNISAGGVCIRTSGEYQAGEKLVFRSRLMPGRELSPIVCEIRRVTPQRVGFEYGCQFVDLSETDEDQIAKIIMEMQRNQVRRQTGRPAR